MPCDLTVTGFLFSLAELGTHSGAEHVSLCRTASGTPQQNPESETEYPFLTKLLFREVNSSWGGALCLLQPEQLLA